MNSSIWLIDSTLTGTTTLSHGGLESNSNKGVLHIPQSSRIGALPSDGLVPYPGHSLSAVLILCRDAISVFYCPSWLDLTPYGLFSVEIWFISKCLIVIKTIFSMFHCILLCFFKNLSMIICQHTVTFDIRYSYLIQIICTQFYGLKNSDHVLTLMVFLRFVFYSNFSLKSNFLKRKFSEIPKNRKIPKK